MKIAIIGAGFTGLAAGWDLTKAGHNVTIFEQADKAGGLAGGFNRPNWDWSLDEHYHHLFASDSNMGDWLKELGLDNLIHLHDVKTKSLIGDKKYRLDSPLSLLRLPMLNWIEKFRVAAVLAFFKLLPSGEWLERFGAVSFLRFTMGEKAYQVLWQALMVGKFGELAEDVNLAWFWSRIKARTKLLGYPEGGFDLLAKEVVRKLEKAGVAIKLSTPVKKIEQKNGSWQVTHEVSGKNQHSVFDEVLVTGTHNVLSKLVPDLPSSYLSSLDKLKILGAVTLVLELDEPFFDDDTYWLSISQSSWPFLAAVEHTNLTGATSYGGSSILYLGNYLPPNHRYYNFFPEQLLNEFKSHLLQLNPDFEKHIKKSWVFSSKLAQPVVEKYHSRILPHTVTPLNGLYWSSMQHVYPWDRGINYAVKAGRDVVKSMVRKET
jgi:protoporphyrinogen oxidase